MLRDVNTSGKNPGGKSHSKHHSFIGEQPRKLADRSGKSSARNKKYHSYSALQDMDDLSRGRHIYHRAATKNITREMLRTNQF
ncbi:MAG TPA: hypothetical protein VIM59_10915 [Cellvibrio sp.]